MKKNNTWRSIQICLEGLLIFVLGFSLNEYFYRVGVGTIIALLLSLGVMYVLTTWVWRHWKPK